MKEEKNIPLSSHSEFPPLTNGNGNSNNWANLVKISGEGENKISKAWEHMALAISLMR